MSLMITTGDRFDGYQIVEYLGIVRGISIRSPRVGQGFEALGNVLSGNYNKVFAMYEEICDETRAVAHNRLLKSAQELGADGIIAMRYETCSLTDSTSEVLAYGTAVKLRPVGAAPLA